MGIWHATLFILFTEPGRSHISVVSNIWMPFTEWHIKSASFNASAHHQTFFSALKLFYFNLLFEFRCYKNVNVLYEKHSSLTSESFDEIQSQRNFTRENLRKFQQLWSFSYKTLCVYWRLHGHWFSTVAIRFYFCHLLIRRRFKRRRMLDPEHPFAGQQFSHLMTPYHPVHAVSAAIFATIILNKSLKKIKISPY